MADMEHPPRPTTCPACGGTGLGLPLVPIKRGAVEIVCADCGFAFRARGRSSELTWRVSLSEFMVQFPND